MHVFRKHRCFKLVLILATSSTFLWFLVEFPSIPLNHKMKMEENTRKSVHNLQMSKFRHDEGYIIRVANYSTSSYSNDMGVLDTNHQDLNPYSRGDNDRSDNTRNSVHDLNKTTNFRLDEGYSTRAALNSSPPKSNAMSVLERKHYRDLNFQMRKAQLINLVEARKRKVLNPYSRGENDRSDNTSEIEKYYNLSRKIITPLNYRFLLSNQKLCSKKPFMIMIVPSSAGNFKARRAIRFTYGRFGIDKPVYSSTENSTVEICVVFIMGLSENKTINHIVRHEFNIFNDVILADFVDSYYNLTLKVLLGLKWVQHYCPTVQYVLKTDDDVFVNIPLLVSHIERFPREYNGSVFGTIMNRGLRVEYRGKWGIDETEYPLKHYPPYAQGTSYTMTGNLVSKIVNTAQYLPYLHIEDAFITGVVACKIHGAKLVHILRNSNWGDEKPSPCRFIRLKRVAQTKMSPTIMMQIWNYLNNPKKCNTTETVIT